MKLQGKLSPFKEGEGERLLFCGLECKYGNAGHMTKATAFGVVSCDGSCGFVPGLVNWVIIQRLKKGVAMVVDLMYCPNVPVMLKKVLHIRLTEDEFNQLKEGAARLNMTISDYCRTLMRFDLYRAAGIQVEKKDCD